MKKKKSECCMQHMRQCVKRTTTEYLWTIFLKYVERTFDMFYGYCGCNKRAG